MSFQYWLITSDSISGRIACDDDEEGEEEDEGDDDSLLGVDFTKKVLEIEIDRNCIIGIDRPVGVICKVKTKIKKEKETNNLWIYGNKWFSLLVYLRFRRIIYSDISSLY